MVIIDLLYFVGDKWQEHRKILTPTFHFKILEDYVQVFNSKSQDLVQKLQAHVGQPFVDINSLITMCTLDIICGKMHLYTYTIQSDQFRVCPIPFFLNGEQ
jgi:cytochrome P450